MDVNGESLVKILVMEHSGTYWNIWNWMNAKYTLEIPVNITINTTQSWFYLGT